MFGGSLCCVSEDCSLLIQSAQVEQNKEKKVRGLNTTIYDYQQTVMKATSNKAPLTEISISLGIEDSAN